MERTPTQRAFASYVQAYTTGADANPARFLRRVSPHERAQLAELIDAFLIDAPRRDENPSPADLARIEQIVSGVLARIDRRHQQ